MQRIAEPMFGDDTTHHANGSYCILPERDDIFCNHPRSPRIVSAGENYYPRRQLIRLNPQAGKAGEALFLHRNAASASATGIDCSRAVAAKEIILEK